MACERSLFLGDVVVDADTVCSLTTTDGTSSITIYKGSWFSSPIAFWAYIQYEHIDQTSGDIQPQFEIIDDQSEYCARISFLEAITAQSIDNANLASDVGWSSTIEADGNTDNFPSSFRPIYPIYQYERNIQTKNVSSSVAEDGTVFSSRGIITRTLSLGVSLSAVPDTTYFSSVFSDILGWANLWNNRWKKGRAVTFWLDPDFMVGALETTPNASDWDFVRRGDILVYPAANPRLQSTRLIPGMDYLNKSDVYTFNIKQPHPLTASVQQASRLL